MIGRLRGNNGNVLRSLALAKAFAHAHEPARDAVWANARAPIRAAPWRFRGVFPHLGAVAAYARRRGSRDTERVAAEVMAIAWRRLADSAARSAVGSI
jgi:hypothetical protein